MFSQRGQKFLLQASQMGKGVVQMFRYFLELVICYYLNWANQVIDVIDWVFLLCVFGKGATSKDVLSLFQFANYFFRGLWIYITLNQ